MTSGKAPTKSDKQPAKPNSAPAQTQNVIDLASEAELTSDSTDQLTALLAPQFNSPNPASTTAIQRSLDLLQKAPTLQVRQHIMRTLQKKYGNNYTAQVAGTLQGKFQVQRDLQTDLVNYFNESTNPDPLIRKKAKGSLGGPAGAPAYTKPINAGTFPMPSIQNNLATPNLNSGNLEAAGSGKAIIYSNPVEGFKGSSVIIGKRTNANGEWQQNSAKGNEAGQGNRVIWQGEKDNTQFHNIVTNGNLNFNSSTESDSNGVKAVTVRNDNFSGSQNQKTTLYPGGQNQTISNSATNNKGNWNYTEEKNSNYNQDSQEFQRDSRTTNNTKVTSTGSGVREQTATVVENKNNALDFNSGTTQTATTTRKDSRDKVDGTWNTTNQITTDYAAGNKDLKVQETITIGSGGNGVRDISQSSSEQKYDNGNYSRNEQSRTNAALTQGNWNNLYSENITYSNKRSQSLESITGGSGTRQQNEQIQENKRTYTAPNGTNTFSQVFNEKTSEKSDKQTGNWNERTTTQTRDGSWQQDSRSIKNGQGSRLETSSESSKDYVDNTGRERNDSVVNNKKTIRGSETTNNVTTTGDRTGWSYSNKSTYFKGDKFNQEYRKTLNAPKDQLNPPPKPKYQEAVIWNHDFLKGDPTADTTKQAAKNQGTYWENGKATDPHYTEAYQYRGGYGQKSSKATVTTGSAAYAGSIIKGYSLQAGQYNQTDKGKLGQVEIRNDLKAGYLVGANGTIGGGGTISWNGDPSVAVRGNVGGFVGAKGTVSNTTTANYGKATGTVTAGGEVMAGGTVDARGELGLSTKAFTAQGEASVFAGAKGTLNGQATVGYGTHNFITTKGSVEGSLGIGGSAKGTAHVDWTTGTVTIGAGLAGTLGVGTGASGEVSVNFAEMGMAGLEAAKDIYDVRHQIKQKVGNKLKQIQKGATKSYNATVTSLKQQGKSALQKAQKFIDDRKQDYRRLQNKYNTTVANFQKSANQLVSKGQRKWQEAKQAGKKFLQKINQKLEQTQHSIINGAQQKLHKLQTQSDKVRNQARQYGNKLLSQAKQTVHKMRKNFDNFRHSVSQQANQAWQQGKKFVHSAKQTANQFSKQYNQTVQKISKKVHHLKQQFNQTVKQAQDYGRKVMHKAEAKFQEAKKVTQQVTQKISNKVENLRQKAWKWLTGK